MKRPKKILLRQFLAPGDSVALSALARDLVREYPDIQVGVAVAGRELFDADPALVRLDGNDPEVQVVSPSYVNALKANQLGAAVHYLGAHHLDFENQTGLIVPWTDPRPHIILTEEEERTRPVDRPYWVVCAGHKSDMTIKGWSRKRFQAVVDQTTARGIHWVQIGRSRDERFFHLNHEPLANVDYRVDQTNLRQLAQLIRHADGVLCGVSLPMLLAAAFWRPCVVLAGGRENWTWQAYTRDNPALGTLAAKVQVPHHFLHTVGQLDCCRSAGCLCCSVVPPHNDSAFPPGFLCTNPTLEPGGQPLAQCLAMIPVEQVVAAILSY